jgi:hypothetical protein
MVVAGLTVRRPLDAHARPLALQPIALVHLRGHTNQFFCNKVQDCVVSIALVHSEGPHQSSYLLKKVQDCVVPIALVHLRGHTTSAASPTIAGMMLCANTSDGLDHQWQITPKLVIQVTVSTSHTPMPRITRTLSSYSIGACACRLHRRWRSSSCRGRVGSPPATRPHTCRHPDHTHTRQRLTKVRPLGIRVQAHQTTMLIVHVISHHHEYQHLDQRALCLLRHSSASTSSSLAPTHHPPPLLKSTAFVCSTRSLVVCASSPCNSRFRSRPACPPSSRPRTACGGPTPPSPTAYPCRGTAHNDATHTS